MVANRLLVERALPDPPGEAKSRPVRRPRRTVTMNLAESPLGWLRSRGHIDERQFEAGERLRADWERAQLAPAVTMRWDPALSGRDGAGPALDPTEAQLAAKSRFEAAVAEVGPGMSDLLWRIICAGEGMREAERALGWPARAGKLILAFALDRLAAYYRIR
jgi:hypothetical protein